MKSRSRTSNKKSSLQIRNATTPVLDRKNEGIYKSSRQFRIKKVQKNKIALNPTQYTLPKPKQLREQEIKHEDLSKKESFYNLLSYLKARKINSTSPGIRMYNEGFNESIYGKSMSQLKSGAYSQHEKSQCLLSRRSGMNKTIYRRNKIPNLNLTQQKAYNYSPEKSVPRTTQLKNGASQYAYNNTCYGRNSFLDKTNTIYNKCKDSCFSKRMINSRNSSIRIFNKTITKNFLNKPLKDENSQTSLISEDQYEKDLEHAIKNMTDQKYEDNFLDLKPKKKIGVKNNTDFAGFLEEDPFTRKVKAKNKLKLLKRYQYLFNYVEVSENIQEFINNLIKWFRNEQPRGYDFMVTPSGCIMNNPKVEITEQGTLLEDMKLAAKTKDFEIHDNIVIMTERDTIIEGKFEFDIPQEGKVCALFLNGDYYEGDYKNYMKTGKGVLHYLPKHINLIKDTWTMKFEYDSYNGDFIGISLLHTTEDKKIGKAFVQFHDGSEYIGQFMNNEIEGNGIFTDSDGNKYKTFSKDDSHRTKRVYNKEGGSFVKGKLYGLGEILFKNENVYNGNLKGSKRDGTGKMVYIVSETGIPEDIGTYDGNWVRDQRSGQGEMRFQSGEEFNGQWKNDMMHFGRYSYLDQTYYIGHFHEGKRGGEGTIHLHDGIKI